MIAQAAFELRLLLRNGEQLLLTVIIPMALLVGVTLVDAVPLGVPAGAERLPVALGGVLAVAVIASGFTSLAISVGFDRRSGALLMLATTPLSRQGILGARALAAMAMVAIQVVVLVVTAALLGWRPTPAALALVPIALLGTAAFAALGFALGGAVRAEATLAVANAVFLALVAVGGTTYPADQLPAPLSSLVSLLPSSALADLLRWSAGAASTTSGALPVDAVILGVWGAIGAVIAARTFRWR
ncbi:MAG: ABC transporter permease [Actinobacteria bacterium]|nr:ABC transporter permease [Actinomycetota bacterium]